ncbi:hypothetical protein OIU85_000022 [Salix viminalis]|uniref:Uncharacterized protein n=1 Tax=Salix viminalis TaxID=40686 RepID=A0A9Q0VIP0_SALVM|nr:hypothetical protein OIU85_000022 [Salix viminalis]
MYSPGKESDNMGCISSKLVCRSLSFQEELTKNMQRSANDIPALEELAISGNINDHFFALVCTANTVACKYKSNKPVVEPDTSLEKTKPEFNATNEVSYPSVESFHGVEEKRRNHEGVWRGKSFHTIEEFDALIEKLNLSKEQKIGCDGEDDGSVTGVKLNHFRSSTHASEHSKDSNIIQETNSHMNDSSPPEANSTMEENLTLSTSELAGKKLIAIPSRSNTAAESTVVEDSSQGHVLKKGFKRKSIAKRLESIEIPQIIEFPAVTGLKEWLRVGGQVYSADAYVTPNEEDIFNPELVAACEESMEQLEAEAENILKQIVEKLEEESGRNEEEISF